MGYARSETAMKEQCAEQQVLIKKARSPLATWDVLRSCLRDVLQEVQESGYPLSNIKRILRSRFKVDLSETALGHATATELFKDARLQDICSVRLLDSGYVLFPEFVTEMVEPEVVEPEVVEPEAFENFATPAAPLPLLKPSVLSTTPFMVRGTSACVHVPSASPCNAPESQPNSAAWDLMCSALDIHPHNNYTNTLDFSRAVVSQRFCGLGTVGVPTEEVEQFQTSASASECESQDGIFKACDDTEGLSATMSTTFGDFSSSSSDISVSLSLPSTPRELGEATPSPNMWSDGSFAQEFRMALEAAASPRSSPAVADIDVACSFSDRESESEGTEWPSSQISIKNTFIDIGSTMEVMGESPTRQARSLPTSPFEHMSGGLDAADVVFKWNSLPLISASQEGEFVTEDREDFAHSLTPACEIRFGTF